jgi:hypothetical protein
MLQVAGLSSPRYYSCLPRNLSPAAAFTAPSLQPTLAVVKFIALVSLLILVAQPTYTQQKSPEVPAQIELLETRVRFETSGDSRKEVHARVKINNELGARQFARLNFDYNRTFEQVEIPLVRVTHPSGGISDILPSAITDIPNPAVVNAPAYQDVRVRSLRILGLGAGDSLEYRVVTSVSHHPLAPYFWLDHSFDRTGVVIQEIFQVDLPASRPPAGPVVVKNEQIRAALQARLYAVPPVWTASPLQSGEPTLVPSLSSVDDASPGIHLFLQGSTPTPFIERSGKGEDARVLYTWERATSAKQPEARADSPAAEEMSDIEFGVSPSGWDLSHALSAGFVLPEPLPEEIIGLSQQLTQGAQTPIEKTERIYDFVSKKILTIDLPLGATGFRPRPAGEILSSGYAIPEDKFFLFEALAKSSNLHASAALIGPSKKIGALVVGPAAFVHILILVTDCDCWLDPTLEVAPFRALPASYLGSSALFIGPFSEVWDQSSLVWTRIPKNLPFASSQKVDVAASLDPEGKLTAKVKYMMRGENELLLRVAFHHTAQEKWREVAQLLALSDGFRGQITNVNASDPYATKEPFMVEYEISQLKFVDWSKKPVRIPAILPLVGLPDPPAKSAPGATPSPIDLGTPLDVEAHVTLHLPAGTAATAPIGTSVERDYATFSSKYGILDAEYPARNLKLSASRHLHFLLREIPAARAADYNTFLRAVQNDEAQEFTLEHTETVSPKTNSAAPSKPAPPQPNAQKP